MSLIANKDAISNIDAPTIIIKVIALNSRKKITTIYYINTSEIPSELSRENFISSHVKITCYLHT